VVAVRLASSRRRNDRMAGSAAVRAILRNPLKALSRPGLLRLAARPIVHIRRGPATERIRSRNPQPATPEVHNDEEVGLG
jgi:hypothetical protein